MSMNSQIDLSKLCGRKISDEEATRIREVASNLELRDDDALWQLLAAIEYQKTYYEKIPKRIENASDKLMESIKKSAEKEVEKSQAILAESVVKHAKELSFSMKIEIIIPMIFAVMIIFFGYGGIMQWVGFNMATKEYFPIVNFLRMDIGGLLIGLLTSLGSMFAFMAIFKFVDNLNKGETIYNSISLTHIALSAGTYSIVYMLFNTMFK